ncbi:endoplasmic reticulum-Golgi intermediate compartment protein 2, partial [Tremellales sp. Uapishka_1]
MYEPHLVDHASQHSHSYTGEGMSLLDELDKIAPIKAFDAFPKVQSTYTVRSRRGGVLTAVVGVIIFLLVLNDLGEFLYGAPDYKFNVDQELEKDLQLNVDLTVAMPCHYLTIDLRDAVGDRLHLSDEFKKDGTTFEVGKASSMKSLSPTIPSASNIIKSARRHTPNQKRSLGGIRSLFSKKPRTKKQHAAYRPTIAKVDNGPACRIYGSVEVKKVTANLHVTTLGHGYMSHEHTDHTLMNLTHVIHEFSFGPFFPAISQPLDLSLETTDQPFTIFQYFLRIVPTTYIDASRRKLVTSQYAVTDYSHNFEHGRGVPGIFFKYDLEAMALTIRERTTSLYQFLIRLVGVVGGVWTVAAFGLRVLMRAQREVSKVVVGEKEIMPSSIATPSPAAMRDDGGSYFGGGAAASKVMSRAGSWMSGKEGSGKEMLGDWKGR